MGHSIAHPPGFRSDKWFVDPAVKKNKFLIVENDPNDAFLIKRALNATSCGVSSVCRNPSEAKAYLLGAGMYADRNLYPMPEVVLTDIRMEPESGLDLVQWIRQQEPPLRDLKIIILSGSASPLQFDAAQKIGAQSVHNKPNNLQDLQKLLASIAAEYCP